MINSNLVEGGRLLMDPQVHPLLHFLVRMKPTSTNLFLCSSVFLDHTINPRYHIRHNGSMSRAQIVLQWCATFAESLLPLMHTCQGHTVFVIHSRHATMNSECSSTLSHLSVLLCLPPFPILDDHTLHYTHLQSNKQTTVWTFAFSLCMSSTLQMAVLILNNRVVSFWEECVLWRMFGFHLTAPYSYH